MIFLIREPSRFFTPSISAMSMSRSAILLVAFGLASSEAVVLRRSQSAPMATLPPMAWIRQQLKKPDVVGTGGTTPC